MVLNMATTIVKTIMPTIVFHVTNFTILKITWIKILDGLVILNIMQRLLNKNVLRMSAFVLTVRQCPTPPVLLMEPKNANLVMPVPARLLVII
jgi:hypothetical protein